MQQPWPSLACALLQAHLFTRRLSTNEANSPDSSPAVASHVPAFLKAHAHLLHGKARKESEPVVDQGPDDDSDFERDDGVRLPAFPLCDSVAQTSDPRALGKAAEVTHVVEATSSAWSHCAASSLVASVQGALARAIAENPALAAQDSSLQRRADKVLCWCCRTAQ